MHFIFSQRTRKLTDVSSITISIFFSVCCVKSANNVRITISPGRKALSPEVCISIMPPAVAAIDERVCVPQGNQTCRGDVTDVDPDLVASKSIRN